MFDSTPRWQHPTWCTRTEGNDPVVIAHRDAGHQLLVNGEHRVTVELHQLDEHFHGEQLVGDAEIWLRVEDVIWQGEPLQLALPPVEARILLAMLSDATRRAETASENDDTFPC